MRGIVVAATGDLSLTEKSANKIGRMDASGAMVSEYQIPPGASGARCIVAASDGRLFFAQYAADLIGEIVPQ